MYKWLRRMLAKQESLLSALQSLTETHADDEDGLSARATLMTWESTGEAVAKRSGGAR